MLVAHSSELKANQEVPFPMTDSYMEYPRIIHGFLQDLQEWFLFIPELFTWAQVMKM
jgi:hypothetical protein